MSKTFQWLHFRHGNSLYTLCFQQMSKRKHFTFSSAFDRDLNLASLPLIFPRPKIEIANKMNCKPFEDNRNYLRCFCFAAFFMKRGYTLVRVKLVCQLLSKSAKWPSIEYFIWRNRKSLQTGSRLVQQ